MPARARVRAAPIAAEIELEGQPVEQGRRRHARPLPTPSSSATSASRAGMVARQPVALEPHLARVEHGRQARRRGGRQPLGHGEDHDPAIGLGQEAALARPAGRRASVAARSSPPRSRSSPTWSGTRRTRRAGGQECAAAGPASGRAPGPASARSATPPRPAGSTASRAAASAASAQAVRGSPVASRAEQLHDGTLDPDRRAGLVQRVAPQPVAQGRGRDPAQVRVARPSASPSRLASARAARIRVSSPRRPSVPSADAEPGRPLQRRVGDLDRGQPLARGLDLPAQPRRPPCAHCADEGRRIALERVAPAHHLDPGRQVLRRPDLDREAEPVEELRPQLALLRVAAADQDEAGRVADAQALALDQVLARGRDVEQEVDQVVLEQVRPRRCRGSRDARGPAGRARTPSRRAPAPARGRGRRPPGPPWRPAAGRPPAPGGGSAASGPAAAAPAGIRRRARRPARARSRSGSRPPPASAAGAPPVPARPSTCRCRGRRRPGRRRRRGRPRPTSSASFISSWPTIAENGNTMRMRLRPRTGRAGGPAACAA